MELEQPTSLRCQYLSNRRFDIEEIPVLLFPSFPDLDGPAVRVPSSVHASSSDQVEAFDKPWGFGKFTLDRTAGVYLYPDPTAGAGDAVIVLEESGRTDWGERQGRCPWGPGHNGIRLAEMLQRWPDMVEKGVWGVGKYGVEGSWR